MELSSAGATRRGLSHPGYPFAPPEMGVPWLTVAEGLHGAQQPTVGAYKSWFPLLVAHARSTDPSHDAHGAWDG